MEYETEINEPSAWWGFDSGAKIYPTIDDQRPGFYSVYSESGKSVELQFVPKTELGYGVLGRSIPERNFAQVDYSLRGEAREKVVGHELCHIDHPEWSELEVRVETDTLAPEKVLKMNYSFGENNEIY